mgnify:FL=1
MYQKDIDRISKDILNHNQEMIDHARLKAQEIIATASEKANEIISNTETFSADIQMSTDQVVSEIKESQKQEFNKARDLLLNQYKTFLEEIYKDNINLFKSVSKDIEEAAVSEIKSFRSVLEKETLESQKIVGEKIEGEYRQAEQEIEDFKNKELARLHDNFYKITQRAIELAIGKSLDRGLHEDLVMDGLKEAIEKGAD